MVLFIVFAVSVVLFLVVAIYMVAYTRYQDGYKKGQVDAATGKMKYFLIEFKNGKRAWHTKEIIKELTDESYDFKVMSEQS